MEDIPGEAFDWMSLPVDEFGWRFDGIYHYKNMDDGYIICERWSEYYVRVTNKFPDIAVKDKENEM